MSLDGYVAGPNQSLEEPLGRGGEGLHDWVVPLEVWRRHAGMEGGEVNESSAVVEESVANLGATIMGRNMFGGGPGPWNTEQPWKGWWGPNPPYHHATFILTHHARDPIEMEGGTVFHFVTEGMEAALERAQEAAGAQDINLAGGASTANQYLAAGLVDEMLINLVPRLLGGGARLFDGVGDDLHGLELVGTVATPQVVHLKFAR